MIKQKTADSDIRTTDTRTLRKYAKMLETLATEVAMTSDADPGEVQAGVREILDLCERICKELEWRDKLQAEVLARWRALTAVRN